MPDQNMALPSEDEAFATLNTQVFQRTFFSKLAGYGIVPQSDAEAGKMLELAQQLEIAESMDNAKQASVHSDVDMALSRTGEYLHQYGYSDEYVRYQRLENDVIRKNASVLACDPSIQAAVLSLTQAALAEAAQG